MGNNRLFETATLTSSGRPVFLPNEVECQLLSNVDLEAEEESSSLFSLQSGLLILTTHRLLWFSSSSSSSAAPPVSASIPLASITHIFSPKKSIKSIFTSHRIRFQVTATDSRSVVIKVVVRGKVDWDGFLGNVWDCWRGRAWESFDTSERPCASGGLYGTDGSVRMVGVAGILRKEQEMWETTDKSLQDAFQDLNALMSKAKEMVMLAEKMRQKLLSGSSTQTSSTNEDEIGSKEEMHDWLLSVGIVSPVTKESVGALYHQQLSR